LPRAQIVDVVARADLPLTAKDAVDLGLAFVAGIGSRVHRIVGEESHDPVQIPRIDSPVVGLYGSKRRHQNLSTAAALRVYVARPFEWKQNQDPAGAFSRAPESLL